MSGTAELVVGVDLGTTETKAVLTTFDGVQVGFARRSTSWTQGPDGRPESTGTTLLGDVLRTVQDALSAYQEHPGPPARIAGIGIAGLAESGVVLDARGRESSPVIPWYDERGGRELAALDPAFLALFPSRTGLRVGSQWTLAKLLWLRTHGVALGPGSRWLNIPEFVAWALAGEQVSEPSLSSRTGLTDQATGAAWPAALGVLGAPADLLPPSVQAGTAAGRVRRCPAMVELEGAVVTVAGHDHPVAAVGAGVVGPEDLFDSCGTAEVLLRSVPRGLEDTERAALVALGFDAGRHVLPGYSAVLGGTRSGLVMQRVLALIGAGQPGARDELDRAWRPVQPGSTTAVSVSGSATDADDVVVRLRAAATPDMVWAATLEHLGGQTSALLAGVTAVVGEHRCAVAAGGWTRLRSVRQSKARSISRLSFCRVEQPGARGAALLAATAALGELGVDQRARCFAATAEPAAQPSGPPVPPSEDPAPPGVDQPTTDHLRPPSTGSSRTESERASR